MNYQNNKTFSEYIKIARKLILGKIGYIFFFIGIFFLALSLLILLVLSIISEINKGEKNVLNIFLYILAFPILGFVFSVIGNIFLLITIKKIKQHFYIIDNGIDVSAVIINLRRNYSYRSSRRAIYFVVDYSYEDKYNNKHIGTETMLSESIVIKENLKVGDNIPIKVLPNDYTKSTLTFWLDF